MGTPIPSPTLSCVVDGRVERLPSSPALLPPGTRHLLAEGDLHTLIAEITHLAGWEEMGYQAEEIHEGKDPCDLLVWLLRRGERWLLVTLQTSGCIPCSTSPEPYTTPVPTVVDWATAGPAARWEVLLAAFRDGHQMTGTPVDVLDALVAEAEQVVNSNLYDPWMASARPFWAGIRLLLADRRSDLTAAARVLVALGGYPSLQPLGLAG